MALIEAFIGWLFSPEPSLWTIAVGLGLGVTLAIAPQLRNIRLSHFFFGISWFWAFGCLVREISVNIHSSKYSVLLVFFATGMVGVACLLTYRWVERNHHETKGPEAASEGKSLPSLKQLFDNEWPNMPAYYNVSVFEGDNLQSKKVTVEWRMEGDFVARSKFLALFINSSTPPADTQAVCVHIAENYQWFIETADSKVDIIGKMPDDTSATHLKDMLFSKRVFVYYESPDFSMTQKGELESTYRSKGLSIQFRDAAYAWLHREDHIEPRTHPFTPNTVIFPDATKFPGLAITVRNLEP